MSDQPSIVAAFMAERQRLGLELAEPYDRPIDTLPDLVMASASALGLALDCLGRADSRIHVMGPDNDDTVVLHALVRDSKALLTEIGSAMSACLAAIHRDNNLQ